MNDNLERRAVEFEKMFTAKYGEAQKYVTSHIMVNLLNGCPWDFISDQEAREHFDLVKQTGARIYKLRNGGLLLGDFATEIKILTDAVGTLYTQRDLDEAITKREKAIAELDKYVKKNRGGNIGIYNLNDSSAITIQGHTYKAFNVDIEALVAVCQANGLQGIVKASQSMTKSELLSKLSVAPSQNALLIQI